MPALIDDLVKSTTLAANNEWKNIDVVNTLCTIMDKKLGVLR